MDNGSICLNPAESRHVSGTYGGAGPFRTATRRAGEAGGGLGTRIDHRNFLQLLALFLTFALSHLPTFAAGSPVLSSVLPRGGQRGTQVVTEFSGARLDKALGVIFDEPGIELT